MKFLHLQLQTDGNQLILHIQTHQQTEHFQLVDPVANPQELAHQAQLFVSIHLRPFFDMLPVESCRLSITAQVPELIRDSCIGELIKVTQTNEILTKAKADIDEYLANHLKASSSPSTTLCVYTEQMPLEGLLQAADFRHVDGTRVVAYCPARKPSNDDEHYMQLLNSDQCAWLKWYLKQGYTAILCGEDFVNEVERQGIVLSAVLSAVGHQLIIFEAPFQSGHPLLQYKKRSTDSGIIIHLVQDEKSIFWGQWLGLHRVHLGSLKSLHYGYEPLEIKHNGVTDTHIERDRTLKKPALARVRPHEECQLQILICEAIDLRQMIACLPQAYSIKQLLDQHFKQSLSGIVATELWLNVMRRLIVGSNESTDYDVIFLIRRLERIAEAVQSLQLIDFIQKLAGKADVLLVGHPDWEKILPNQFKPDYAAHDWARACQVFPDAMMLVAAPVFNPVLSKKCYEAILNGRRIGCFAPSLYQLEAQKIHHILGLDWLEQQSIISPDGCCVHALSVSSGGDSMVDKRQAIVNAMAEHNTLISHQVSQQFSSAAGEKKSPVSDAIEQQLIMWHASVEDFYNTHGDLFQESVIVLNPQAELGISDDIRANPPPYLAAVLSQMTFSHLKVQ